MLDQQMLEQFLQQEALQTLPGPELWGSPVTQNHGVRLCQHVFFSAWCLNCSSALASCLLLWLVTLCVWGFLLEVSSSWMAVRAGWVLFNVPASFRDTHTQSHTHTWYIYIYMIYIYMWVEYAQIYVYIYIYMYMSYPTHTYSIRLKIERRWERVSPSTNRAQNEFAICMNNLCAGEGATPLTGELHPKLNVGSRPVYIRIRTN